MNLRPLIDDDTIALAIRLLLGRPPRDTAEVAALREHRSTATLRLALMQGEEFQRALPRSTRASSSPGIAYALPLDLLRPPDDPAIPWRFVAPDLRQPVSQLCTASQFEEPDYRRWCGALREAPKYHRKQWEFVWQLAVLDKAGLLKPGARGLGFGTGREKMPSLFAKLGIEVVASDAPKTTVETQGWAATGQHATSQDDLFHDGIVTEDVFAARVQFQEVDMNAIPAKLTGFDFCWSSCALEHLGSIKHGLDFIDRSLETLRPGGIAVHTTEFNLSSDEATLETPGLVLFRRQDVLALAARLMAAGHRVWPINLHPGDAPIDAHIDLPPYALPHLKLLAQGWVTTSLGIAVERGPVNARG